MIEKKINYIWLSNNRIPKLNKICMDSWAQALPNYKIKCWTLKDFNVEKMPYVKSALSVKNFAFAADYLRSWILYNKGGIYLDTDIYAIKNFEEFLHNQFFSFVEYHHDSVEHVIQAAFVGCEAEHPIAKEYLEYFNNHNFENPNTSNKKVPLCPDIFATCTKKFGFKDVDETQKLKDGAMIYSSSYVAGTIHEYQKGNYAIHCCAGSWRKKDLLTNILTKKQQINFLRTLNS